MTNIETTGGTPAISSLEIAKITGKPHKNVMADIRRILTEAEIDQLEFQLMRLDDGGREQPYFVLPKLECDLVISGYSVKYRLAIIKRWHELEAQAVPPVFVIPSTLSGALMLASQQAEIIERQQELLAIAAPKEAFFDIVTGSGLACEMAIAAQTAKLGFGRNILYQKLRDDGVLISGGARHNLPKQGFVNQGLFVVNEGKYTNPKTDEPIITFTTYVTNKGLAWIIKKYGNA